MIKTAEKRKKMDIRKTRACERCKAQVTLDKVRLLPKNKDQNILVCIECSEIIKQKQVPVSNDPAQKQKALVTNVYRPKEPLKPFRPKDAPVSVKPAVYSPLKPYLCTRCNYTFKANREKAGLQYRLACPYCSKDDRLTPIK